MLHRTRRCMRSAGATLALCAVAAISLWPREPMAQQVVYHQIFKNMCAEENRLNVLKMLVRCPFRQDVIDAVNREWKAANDAQNAILAEICSPTYTYINTSPEARETVKDLAGKFNGRVFDMVSAAGNCDTTAARMNNSDQIALLSQIRSTLSADAYKRIMADAPRREYARQTREATPEVVKEGLKEVMPSLKGSPTLLKAGPNVASLALNFAMNYPEIQGAADRLVAASLTPRLLEQVLYEAQRAIHGQQTADIQAAKRASDRIRAIRESMR